MVAIISTCSIALIHIRANPSILFEITFHQHVEFHYNYKIVYIYIYIIVYVYMYLYLFLKNILLIDLFIYFFFENMLFFKFIIYLSIYVDMRKKHCCHLHRVRIVDCGPSPFQPRSATPYKNYASKT